MAIRALFTIVIVSSLSGCSHRITARNLDKSANEAEGIPFYLPKPYLIVAKNIRYIPPPTIGLTAPTPIPESFDPAGKEVELKASIDQKRGLTLERKLAESSTFTRAEEDKIDRTIEEKFQRVEEEKFQETVENKLSRLEEDKRLTEQKLNRLEEDKKLIEQKLNRLEEDKRTGTIANPANPNPASPAAPASGGTVTQAEDDTRTTTTGGTEPKSQAPNAPGSGPYGIATNRQVLGVSGHPLVPSTQIPDGLIPETFYTYQIVYLPDLTQKYGLEINDGPGEFRSTMNLVNGWMYTGAGPMYMRDSTTAAQTVATGAAIGNIIDSMASFGFATAGSMIPSPTSNALPPGLSGLPMGTFIQAQDDGSLPEQKKVEDYAELYVFEPVLTETWKSEGFHRYRVKTVEWRLVTSTILGEKQPVRMSRNYLPIKSSAAAPSGNQVTWQQITQVVGRVLPAILTARQVQLVQLIENKESNSVTLRLSGDLTPENQELVAKEVRQALAKEFGQISEAQRLQINFSR